MDDLAVRVARFTNESPFFKGPALIILGIIALAFVLRVNKGKERLIGGPLVFALFSAFIILYGLFIFIFRPHWWMPPY